MAALSDLRGANPVVRSPPNWQMVFDQLLKAGARELPKQAPYRTLTLPDPTILTLPDPTILTLPDPTILTLPRETGLQPDLRHQCR